MAVSKLALSAAWKGVEIYNQARSLRHHLSHEDQNLTSPYIYKHRNLALLQNQTKHPSSHQTSEYDINPHLPFSL